MYSEIASNKRRSVLFIGLFFVLWLAIGAVIGLLFRTFYNRAANNGYGAAPPPHYGWTPVVVGMVICGILAIGGIIYSLTGDQVGAPGLGGGAGRSGRVPAAA